MRAEWSSMPTLLWPAAQSHSCMWTCVCGRVHENVDGHVYEHAKQNSMPTLLWPASQSHISHIRDMAAVEIGIPANCCLQEDMAISFGRGLWLRPMRWSLCKALC